MQVEETNYGRAKANENFKEINHFCCFCHNKNKKKKEMKKWSLYASMPCSNSNNKRHMPKKDKNCCSTTKINKIKKFSVTQCWEEDIKKEWWKIVIGWMDDWLTVWHILPQHFFVMWSWRSFRFMGIE